MTECPRPLHPSFLLVGSDVVVRTTEIIAVLDQPTLDASSTREFLGFSRRKGQVEDLARGDTIKSGVLCASRVLLSPFSATTLRRRLLNVQR